MIKDTLKTNNQAINFQRKVATKANFEEVIRQAPLVLHISCHGIENTKSTMRTNYEEVREQGDFLLFEKEVGDGELVSAKQLRELIERS